MQKLLFWRKGSGTSTGIEEVKKGAEMEAASRMSTFYISHGSPMLPLEEGPTRDFLAEKLASLVGPRPKAILAISAHWDTQEPSVNVVSKNPTIHDFYNFPPELYKLQYPAPGAPDLARQVKSLLQEAGFKTVIEDKKRGLDHGAWSPLTLIYPEADIPVCQLSISSNKNGNHHYRLGRALASLKDEGVLVLASGSAVHNLREIDWSDSGKVPVWSKAFADWLIDAVVNNRHEELIQWEKAPYARRAHPTPDHFLPLLVALGASGEQSKGKLVCDNYTMGLSQASFEFQQAMA
jgi:4,5-DOPA dioxygenase extradiol